MIKSHLLYLAELTAPNRKKLYILTIIIYLAIVKFKAMKITLIKPLRSQTYVNPGYVWERSLSIKQK